MTDLFPTYIETDRLRLERMTTALDPLDAYDFYGRSDTISEETRYLDWSPHETPKETMDAFTRFEDDWENGDDAVYAIFPRDGEPEAGEFAGNTALHPKWEKRTATFGIWLRKPFWGRGYSGERASALMQLAFDRLDFELVAVACFPENERSRRAIEKYVDRFGGQYDGLLRNWMVTSDGPRDVRRYTVSHEQWAENRLEGEPIHFYD